MGVMTVRDIPDDLQEFLKADAAANHRSVNRQVIAALHEYRERKLALNRPEESVADRLALIRRVQAEARARRNDDPRGDDELLGYGLDGLWH